MPLIAKKATKNVSVVLTAYEQLWMDRYRQLVAFQKRNGHVEVSKRENKELNQWMRNQRSYYHKGILRQDREQLLNEIEFVWRAKKEKVEVPERSSWMGHYERLVAFQQRNGHLEVSVAHDRKLKTWINMQRYCKKNNTLNKDQQKLLDKIGFLWAAEKSTSKETKEASIDLVGSNSKAVNKPPEAAALPTTAHEIGKKNQTFAIGTRIEKVFEVDGVLQKFGGDVVAFEYIEDEDGIRTWGYMIHYDDGDREHMLEADVAKNFVVVKKRERAAKSQTTASKRTKRET